MGLSADTPCEELARWTSGGEGPLLVHVSGIKGEVPDWPELSQQLLQLKPRALLSYRWVPWLQTDQLTRELAQGLNRFLHCQPSAQGQTLVLAHSAGGLIAARAAAELELEPPGPFEAPAVTVVTVASPLAGVGRASERLEQLQVKVFAVELGKAIRHYPEVPEAVRVVHLHTDARSDEVMRPGPQGWRPNDPKVGVPGALHLKLPEHLGHVEAFSHVTRAIARAQGRFEPKALLE